MNQFRLEDIRTYGLPDTHQLRATQVSVLSKRIRAHMESLRRRFRRNQRQTAAEIQQAAVISNMRSRMAIKLRRRSNNFERFQQMMEDTLRILSGDCQAVLDTAYMSDEENDAVNEHKLATSLLVELYAFLDAPAGPPRGISLPRTTRNPVPTPGSANEDLHYDHDLITSRLAVSSRRFRQNIYSLGVKKVVFFSVTLLTDSDKDHLNYLMNAFKPNNLAEELDMLSARLIKDINLDDNSKVNALKLSLSRTVNLVNSNIKKIFKDYILNKSFWVEVHNCSIEQPTGLSSKSKSLLEKILNESKDEKGQIVLKQLRLNITTEKLKAIEEEDDQQTAVLDILEIVIRYTFLDPRTPTKINESEMTSYRKVAMILDLIFGNSGIDLVDGETTCKASKVIAKNHESIYGDTIPLNRGFGRRIDLLLSSRNIELSTNEWKRKKATSEQMFNQ
ncbi:hypothetical protein INT47_000735 [Mucor saturninus]|uniref:Uncharacterized protein n=1 Tax=Mucor saturninus TaxID=64648 RepID=A0A8H7V2A7_9FUNG|nr:hypothetical protein INT47_000735 [Mucor saturninus]